MSTEVVVETAATQVAAPVAAAPAPVTPPAETLILGKFKSQADLETAYKALESKLGQRADPAKPVEPASGLTIKPEEKPATIIPPAEGFIVDVLTRAKLDGSVLEQTFLANGKLTDADYAALAGQGIAPKDVNGYLAGRAAQHVIAKQTTEQIQAKAIEIAGGPVQLKNLLDWAGTPQTGFTPVQLQSLQARLEHPDTYQSALQEIKLTYAAKNGSAADAPMLMANAAAVGGTMSPFSTRNEYLNAKAEASAKFGGQDEAWRNDVNFMARLNVTNPSIYKR